MEKPETQKPEMKKQNILLVLKILETESDESHPITQLKIADIISDVYHCDRKTVGRNIAYLIKLGYPIVKTPKGFYLDNQLFSIEESKLIISAIENSLNIPEIKKSSIIERLNGVFNKIIRREEQKQ